MKKLIIIIAAALISFGGTFGVGWFLNSRQAADVDAANAEGDTDNIDQNGLTPAIADTRQPAKLSMAEREMKSLIFDLKEKGNEYNKKLRDLKTEEERLETTRSQIKADIEELNTLRLEMADTVAQVKIEMDKLDKSRVKIAQEEIKNLVTIAATYDKMDAAAASTILVNMSLKSGSESTIDVEKMEDAVKILHYMSDRTKGELLAEMSNREPKLAAMFTQSLKLISLVN